MPRTSRLPLFVLGVLVVIAPCCSHHDEDRAESHPTSRTARTESLGQLLPAERYELVADGVHEGPALAVEDVLANAVAFTAAQPLRVEGDIVAVCQTKGCWMRIGTPEENMFVKFKAGCDRYVAPDAAGRRAIVEGELIIEEVSVDELRHMLEDAGKHAEAAKVTRPETRTRFVATGAAIRK